MNRDSNSPLVTIIFVISFLIVCLFAGIALTQFDGSSSINDRVSIFTATFALLLAVCALISGLAIAMLMWLNYQNRKRVMAEAVARQTYINDCWDRATTMQQPSRDNIIVFADHLNSAAHSFPTHPTTKRRHQG